MSSPIFAAPSSPVFHRPGCGYLERHRSRVMQQITAPDGRRPCRRCGGRKTPGATARARDLLEVFG